MRHGGETNQLMSATSPTLCFSTLLHRMRLESAPWIAMRQSDGARLGTSQSVVSGAEA
jgi:hypothetical protein